MKKVWLCVWVVLLWQLPFLKAQVPALEAQIDSLSQLISENPTDSLAFERRLALAELYFCCSFRDPNNPRARQQELDAALREVEKAHQQRKTATSRALECAVRLERTQFQPRSEALLTLDMCQKELADILRTDPLNPLALTVYGALGVELGKVPPIKRLFARWFYMPLPEEPSVNTAILYLLEARLLGKYQVFVNLKLGEAYMQVRNAREVVESLKACLAAPEVYPYFDAHSKALAQKMLDEYLAARKAR
ncbi:MAG: hypothetical protein RMI34_12510 [Chloroherpetonaceae bacterium]|nr:hypothetical protein [Chloroherpetonaceae bacterium]MCS7210899.1 hypothetical protein [Chloroherpetonaceae bacterium]MDW8020879.1 hypothetical protein [Chloroherpetonaceae bacterium]MDW8466187.1 hypothetical protein [Chloroherpetonaceae bacterium]